MVQFKYCLCFASQETASVAAPIVLIDQKAASEHHSVGACSMSQVGEPSSMFIRWASHPQWQSIDVSVMFQHMVFELLDFGSPFCYTFGICWAPFRTLLGPFGPIGPVWDRPHGPLLGSLAYEVSACRAPLCVSCIKTLNMFRRFSTFFVIA